MALESISRNKTPDNADDRPSEKEGAKSIGVGKSSELSDHSSRKIHRSAGPRGAGAPPFYVPNTRPSEPMIGHEDLLGTLLERLYRVSPTRLLIDGKSGVGKTRLALEIAYDEHISRHFSGGIFMAGLGANPDLEPQLRGWASALAIEHDPTLDIAAQLARVKGAIEQKGKPCLLIIDDVWSVDHARKLLVESPLVSVLFTSRQTDQAPITNDLISLVGPENRITVPPLDEGEAIALLYQTAMLPEPVEAGELAALVALVGGIPLLLNLIGCYLRDQPEEKLWFASVLDDLMQVARDLQLPTEQIEQTRRNLQSGLLARLRHKTAIHAINSRIIMELCITTLQPALQKVFTRLAALPPDPLSFSVETARIVTENDDEQLLEQLVECCLLDKTGTGRYRMHRLLWEWAEHRQYPEVRDARKRLSEWQLEFLRSSSEEQLASWEQHPDNWQPILRSWQEAADDPEKLRANLQTVLPLLIEQGYWNAAIAGLERALALIPRSDRLLLASVRYYLGMLHYRRADYPAAIEHTSIAQQGFEAANQPKSQGTTLILLGDIHKTIGNYAEARSAYERAIALIPETDDRSYAACLTNLALLLQEQGEYEAAQPLYERALAICEQTLGADHPDTATSLNNLANLLQDQGDYKAARPLYERALAICEKAFGPDHPETAANLNNLANLLQDQGNYAGARPLYERALAIHRQVLGPLHPDTAISLNNLANLLQDQGNYTDARPLYERALAIHEQTLGPDHPTTAASLTNLAKLLQAQGDLQTAHQLYERALAIREHSLGPNHPNTASSLANLAGLLREQGDLHTARQLYERALAIHEQTLGENHPNIATSLTHLAGLLQSQGDYAAARPLCERALAIRKRVLGARHPDTAASLTNLALLLQAQGDYEAARPLYEHAIVIHELVLGSDHPAITTGLNNLASLLQAQGDYEAARPLYERALAITEQALGETHPDIASGLNNLALLLKNQGDYDMARTLFERALAIREQILGPDHPDTATSLNNLASLLYNMGDLAAARPLCRRALAIRMQVLGLQHPHTATSLTNLALLYRDEGNLQEAFRMMRRALDIRETTLGPQHPSTLRLRQHLNDIEQRLRTQTTGTQ